MFTKPFATKTRKRSEESISKEGSINLPKEDLPWSGKPEEAKLLLAPALENLKQQSSADAPKIAQTLNFISTLVAQGLGPIKNVLIDKLMIFLSLIDFAAADTSLSRQIRLHTAGILVSLSLDPEDSEAHARFILENAVAIILNQLNEEEDEEINQALSNCLQNLADTGKYNAIFEDVGFKNSGTPKQTRSQKTSSKTTKKKNKHLGGSRKKRTADQPENNGNNLENPQLQAVEKDKIRSESNSKSNSETKSRRKKTSPASVQRNPNRVKGTVAKLRTSGTEQPNTSVSFISSEERSFSNRSRSSEISSESNENLESSRSHKRRNRLVRDNPSPTEEIIKVLCLWDDDNRVIEIPPSITLEGVMTAIQREYKRVPSIIKYNSQFWDEMITITKDADLNVCLSQEKKLILLSKSNQMPSQLLPRTGMSGSGRGFLQEFTKYSWSIPSGELEIERNILGKGFFGEVRLASWRKQQVAAKILYKKDFRNTTESERFIREVDVLSKLRHPKVILFIGASINIETNDMIIVTEFMEGGSLYAFITEEERPLEEMRILSIARDVSLAMTYLHGQHCFHRDLNSKNILLDKTYNAKLADFGLSKFLNDDPLSNSMGAVAWMAPEVLMNPCLFSQTSDVYSFAIVLWEMLTGSSPTCSNLTPIQLARKVIDESYRPTLPSNTNKEHWCDLARKCWDNDPKNRPTFNEILDTINGFLPEKNYIEPEELSRLMAMKESLQPSDLQPLVGLGQTVNILHNFVPQDGLAAHQPPPIQIGPSFFMKTTNSFVIESPITQDSPSSEGDPGDADYDNSIS